MKNWTLPWNLNRCARRGNNGDSVDAEGGFTFGTILQIKNKFSFAVFFLFLLLPLSASAAEASTTQLDLPLFINGRFSTEISVKITFSGEGEESAFIWFESFSPILEELLKDDILLELPLSEWAEAGWVNVGEIAFQALSLTFDSSLLELHLRVPAEMKLPERIAVSRKPRIVEGTAVEPSSFSFFLNLGGGLDVLSYQGETLLPYSLEANTGINLLGWVLEAGILHGFSEIKGGFYVEPGILRVVKDVPGIKSRFVLGDLPLPIRGFQGYTQLQGLGVSKVFTDPGFSTAYQGRATVFISSPSKVEVFLNGRSVKIMDLDPGTYVLDEIAVSSGVNDLVLEITDEFGNISRRRYKIPYDSGLLPKGMDNFSYGIGIPRFQLKLPSISAFHNYGFAEWITAGLNTQLNLDQQLLGAQVFTATGFGTFGLDGAASHINGIGFDFAALLFYRYNNPLLKKGPGFSLQGRYTGEQFGSLGNLDPRNNYSFDFSGNISFDIPGGINTGLSAGYQVGRYEVNPDIINWGISLSASLPGDTALLFQLDMDIPLTGEPVWRGFIGMHTSLSSSRQNLSVRQDLQNGTSGVSWNMKTGEGNDKFQFSAGLEGVPLESAPVSRVFAGVSYPGSRFNGSVSAGYGDSGFRSSLRLGTALVFAGGRLGMSSPITDSFIIVAPNETLKGEFIGVNPVGGDYTAKSDFLGYPVLSKLKSYGYQTVIVEVPELPEGYEMGDSVFTVVPGYKSGTLLRVGTDAVVFARGTLTDRRGTSLSLEGGEITQEREEKSENSSEEDGEEEQLYFFTDPEGGFYLYGLSPGRYTLTLFSFPGVTVDIEIPADALGLYELGKIPVSGILLEE